MIGAWQNFLWGVEWCHDTMELVQIVGLGVLLGVVIAIAILTRLSDRQWRESLQSAQKELQHTQKMIAEIKQQIEAYHPHEK